MAKMKKHRFSNAYGDDMSRSEWNTLKLRHYLNRRAAQRTAREQTKTLFARDTKFEAMRMSYKFTQSLLDMTGANISTEIVGIMGFLLNDVTMMLRLEGLPNVGLNGAMNLRGPWQAEAMNPYLQTGDIVLMPADREQALAVLDAPSARLVYSEYREAHPELYTHMERPTDSDWKPR